MSLFRTKIKAAIADKALQSALDNNAAQRITAQDTAFTGLEEDFFALKKQTHNVRAVTIANLEHHLSQFINNAGNNGFVIHRAADAGEARDIVLDIANRNNARLIAKSKTMMSEEILLNKALEASGIEVVETDLGEYIVQLRDEPPSHIITPAVHLRREDVGETFHEKLGIPYTDDVQTLTNTARVRLRQTFLNADIGISGVNFGVAETGAICIVTNEGNGRMVTTLPRIHIALMGIERLVPDWESFALILNMLPRSATGQKISVYNQLIKCPRRPGEVDGAEERHLVLIDNGRSDLRDSPLAEILYCIRCGACINACPVFREIGGFSYTGRNGDYTPYPGPIGSILSPGLFGQANFGHLAQASTLCGACKEACPADIDLPSLLLRVRSGGVDLNLQAKTNHLPVGISSLVGKGLKIFTYITQHPSLFSLTQKFSAFVSKVVFPKGDWIALPPFTGWGYSKDFPKPARTTFRQRWDHLHDAPRRSETSKPPASDQVGQQKVNKIDQPVSLVDRFEHELKLLGGHFIKSNKDELAIKIISLLKEKGLDEVLAWESEHLPNGLLTAFEENSIQVDFGSNPNIRAGITGASAAIAETGTLIITSGAGRPSSTSLLPEIHMAILEQNKIYKSLPQVLRLREIQDVSSFVLISGPSRTGDIEMTLTIGVHGPGEIYVFCLGD